jgi:hypothetical protein
MKSKAAIIIVAITLSAATSSVFAASDNYMSMDI